MIGFFPLLILLMILNWAFESWVDWKQYQTLNDSSAENIHKEFQDYYDPSKYKTALQYQKENLRFQGVRNTIPSFLFVLFLLGGGLPYLDQLTQDISENSIAAGLLFVGGLLFLRSVIGLPFSWYHTFVIEDKYGFNRTTQKTFFSDILKGTLIGVPLSGFILATILYFFESVGPQAWLYCWIAVTLFQTGLSYIAPAILLPIFNKFQPLGDGVLKDKIGDFSKKNAFSLQGVYTMDSSKRSSKSNAFFTGFGRLRKLVLFDTLLTKNTPDELLAIFAHEVGHFKKKHIIKSLMTSTLTMGILFYMMGVWLKHPEILLNFGISHPNVAVSLVVFSLFAGPFLRLLSVFSMAVSRRHEFEADTYSAQTLNNPEPLITALKKLSVDHLSPLEPHPLKVAMDYSHPPVLKRIEALRKVDLLS